MPADRQDDRAARRAVPAGVYTDREIRYCQSRKHAIEHFAGRWAAKEAILKAMGTGCSRGIAWTDVEVRNGEDGRPQVMICGRPGGGARARNRRDPVLDLALPDLRHGLRDGAGPEAAPRDGSTGRGGLIRRESETVCDRGELNSYRVVARGYGPGLLGRAMPRC